MLEMSPQIITASLMCFPEKLPSSRPLIGLAILSSTAKMTKHQPTATSTPCQARSLVSYGGSWTICSEKVLPRCQVLQEVHQSYLPRKTTAPFSSASTFGSSTISSERTDTPDHWSQTLSTNWALPQATPNLIRSLGTTISAPPLVTSGRPCFKFDIAPLNLLS